MPVTKSKSTTTSSARKLLSSTDALQRVSRTTKAKATGECSEISVPRPASLATYEAPQKWVMAPYMAAVRKWLGTHKFGGVLLDPGMGKTAISLAVFCDAQKAWDKELKAKGLNPEQRRAKRLRAVVIAPRRVVHRVWPSETSKWEEFTHLQVAVVHGSIKIRERASREDADIYAMTHEGAQWFFDGGHHARLDTRVLIVDELSKFKRGTTQRHKKIRPHLPFFSRRICLTGSFTPKSLLDAWGECYIIDEGKALGRWYSKFRSEFFNPSGYLGYIWLPKPDTERIMLARLKDTCISLEAKDYIDLPELVVDDIVFDLPPDVRVAYSEMEKEFLTFVDDDRITAPNAAVAQMKLRQICSGGLYTAPGEAALVHDGKLEILEDLLDELQGKPLFTIFEFKFEAQAIQQKFGTKSNPVPIIDGSTSDKRADEYLDQWNRNELPLLCVQAQAMSHGVNAQEGNAAHILALSLPWDFEIFDQIIRRIWRSGNKSSHVFLHRALARNTVEQDVAKVLVKKEKSQRDFVSALKLRAKNLRV